MPITYTRYVHRKPEPDAVFAVFEDLEEQTVLFFDPVLEATAIGVGELYRRLDLGLRASEVIVFRGADSAFIAALQADPLLPNNLTGKSVLALIGAAANGNFGPVLCAVPGFAPPAEALQIENARQAELNAILQRNQAIFTSNEYHYELPSGLHAEKFVRLGDALRSVYDIRRITDWVMPHLDGDSVIMADTGSLLPLLLDVREQARSRFGWDIEVSTLDRYPQDVVAVSDAIAAVRNRPMVVDAAAADSALGFLFLISVNSSGRLSRLFRTFGPANAKIVVLCETSSSESKADEVLVSIPVTRWDVAGDGRCERCEISPPIRVHPESYELLPSIKREIIRVDKKRAESQAEFWTMADAAGAVQLHVDVPYIVGGQQDYRHFGVYLDTQKLSVHPPYRRICLAALAKLATPDLVLIPEHNTSQAVVELCQEAYARTDVCIVPPGRFNSDLQGRLSNVTNVLVADDAIVTGTTLLSLRAEVFRVTQGLGISPEVNAFAIICRPSSDGPIQALKRRYRGSSVSRMLSGMELFLPEGRHCPWCRERRLLSSFRDKLNGPARDAAQERIRKLESPVTPPLLMVSPADARADLRTHGSFFGNLGQATAFAAGVSAAQGVVQQLGTLGGGIQLNVVDLAMAIDCYFDGPLLASLLRTFNPIHVRYPGSDPCVELAISRIVPALAYPGTLAELALAALDNKISSRQIREHLGHVKSDPCLQMLADLIGIVFA